MSVSICWPKRVLFALSSLVAMAHRKLYLACLLSMLSLATALKQTFVRLASISTVYADSDVASANLYAELLKTCVNKKVYDHLARYQNAPVLYSYSADATSKLCRAQQNIDIQTHPGDLQRRGRIGEEFLSERAFFKSVNMATGHIDSAVLVGTPRVLRNGKKNANLFTAAVDFSHICVL
jgi:hypothetical protein